MDVYIFLSYLITGMAQWFHFQVTGELKNKDVLFWILSPITNIIILITFFVSKIVDLEATFIRKKQD